MRQPIIRNRFTHKLKERIASMQEQIAFLSRQLDASEARYDRLMKKTVELIDPAIRPVKGTYVMRVLREDGTLRLAIVQEEEPEEPLVVTPEEWQKVQEE